MVSLFLWIRWLEPLDASTWPILLHGKWIKWIILMEYSINCMESLPNLCRVICSFSTYFRVFTFFADVLVSTSIVSLRYCVLFIDGLLLMWSRRSLWNFSFTLTIHNLVLMKLFVWRMLCLYAIFSHPSIHFVYILFKRELISNWLIWSKLL